MKSTVDYFASVISLQVLETKTKENRIHCKEGSALLQTLHASAQCKQE